MLCQVCNEREANVHFTQIINGIKTEKHLCEECSKIAKGNNIASAFNFGMPLSFQSILDGIFEVMDKPIEQLPIDEKCPTCGMSFSDFRKIGRVGCSDCYETFTDQINPMIKRVHGNLQHTGKMPNRASGKLKIKKEINILKEQLKTVINNEEYEKAALVRDKIRALEENLKDDVKEGVKNNEMDTF